MISFFFFTNNILYSERAYQKNRNRYDFKQKFTKNQLMNEFLKDTITSKSTHNEPKSYDKILVNTKSFQKSVPFLMESDDELFLLIDNNNPTTSGCSSDAASIIIDSGVQMEYRQYVLNQKLNLSQNAKNMQQKMKNICVINNSNKYQEETPKRKLRSRQYYDQLRHNSLNKRLPTPHSSTIFQKQQQQHQLIPSGTFNNNRLELIQQSIADGLYQLNELCRHEQALVANLSKCCAQYRAQNQMYTTKLGLEMCIDEIQGNLDYYSKEIVDSEFQLFKTQMEINQKKIVLMNLRKMLKNEKYDMRCVKDEKIMCVTSSSDIDFVDNIYEFCDNNKSMIV